MLIRILAENPGKTFTKNFDTPFVKTIKELLREGQDLSVQQILRETLDALGKSGPNDDTLGPLMKMWTREKEKSNAKHYGHRVRPSIPALSSDIPSHSANTRTGRPAGLE